MLKHACPTRRGFTLVELLVVIGIIALLIGILLPVLGRARMAGYSAKCLSNLRQLHQIGAMYTSENAGWCLNRSWGWAGAGASSNWTQGTFVPGTAPADYDTPAPWEAPVSNNCYTWDETPQFMQYANIQIPGDAVMDSRSGTYPAVFSVWLNAPIGMSCPLAVIAIRNRDQRDRVPLRNSYGYNSEFYSPSGTSNANYAGTYAQTTPNPIAAGTRWKFWNALWRYNAIIRPADKIEFADCCDTWLRAASTPWYPKYGEITWTNTPPAGNLVAFRHGKWYCNVVFWDGHAETKAQGDILVNDRDNLNHPDLNDQTSAQNYYKHWVLTAP